MGNSSSSKIEWGKKSTSTEVIEHFGKHAKGKHVIVTGGNSGIGFETARALAMSGSIVTVACRSPTNGVEAVLNIKKQIPDALASFMQLDLTSFASIRLFVAEYKASGQPLHLLINNAGVMACPKMITGEGLEMQFATNHIGHFLLTTLLLDVIKSSGTANEPARIVHVSSDACFLMTPSTGIPFEDINAEKSYNPLERYGSSKLANFLFSKQLQRKFDKERAHVISVSLHPGIITTNLQRHFGDIGNATWLNMIGKIIWRGMFFQAMGTAMKTIPEGAATSLFCALAPDVLQHGGAHYSDCTCSIERHALASNEQHELDLWNISEAIVNK